VSEDDTRRVIEYHVLPALPGTRAYIYAGTPEPWIADVHAWLFVVDVYIDTGDDYGRIPDLSCCRGQPLVVRSADLVVTDWVVLEVLDPGMEPSDELRQEHRSLHEK
jgi:hypothetical protein